MSRRYLLGVDLGNVLIRTMLFDMDRDLKEYQPIDIECERASDAVQDE